jgi:hypothetical protein
MASPVNAVLTTEGTGTFSVIVAYPKGGKPVFRFTLTRDGEAFSGKVGIEEAEIIAHAILHEIEQLKRLLPAT